MNLLNRTIATAAIACSLHAQTYIVDASNGPGTNFTDLPAAIAAVPSGATLHVKAGTYSAFTVQGKALTLLAESLGTAMVVSAAITGIGASDRVHLSGFVLTGNSSPFGRTASVTNCAGNVTLDRISTTSSDASVVVDHCSSVHILTCSLPSAPVVVTASNVEVANTAIVGRSDPLFGPSPALQAILGSFVTISGSTLAGGNAPPNPGGGATAVVITSSTVHVLGQGPNGGVLPTRITGGNGGSNFQGAAPSGGDGISLNTASSARVFGASLVGGQPGSGFHPGQPGVPLRVDATSSVTQNAGFGPSAFLTGTVGQGLVVTASLRGPPSSPALLMLGSVGTFLQPPALALGALTVNPLLVVDGLWVPASGLLQVPITVPLGWPRDTVVFGQFLMLDTALNEVQASNTFTAITR